jgi:hypothetical protein
MNFAVDNSFQVKFQNNVELLLQQGMAGNPLEEAVVWSDDASAEKIKIRDIFPAKPATEGGTRNGRTVWDDPDSDGVWLPKTKELYKAFLIDNADKLQTAISLEGAASTMTATTLTRARIQRVLEGFYGPIISGKQGTTVTTFPGSAEIPVTTGGASGDQPLNTKKLREAKLYLDAGFNPKGLKRYLVTTAEDVDSLLDEMQAVSADLKQSFGAKYDGDGNLMGMMGFNFIHVELDDPMLDTIPGLSTTSGGHRRNPFWVKGGLVANYWQRLRSEVGKIPEIEFNLGTFGGTTLAATRTQAARCGIILNKKA